LGFWELEGGGVGERVGDRGGQFTSNLGPRWTDPVTARRIPSKSKGVERGAKRSKAEQSRVSKGR
jgi:hypothetical protein